MSLNVQIQHKDKYTGMHEMFTRFGFRLGSYFGYIAAPT